MDETYRMLGREHEADLERDALKWRLHKRHAAVLHQTAVDSVRLRRRGSH
jgi:hypothetical protein